MTTPNRQPSPTDADRRATSLSSRPSMVGVPVREDDIEPTKGLHSVAILFRILSGMLVLLIGLQVLSGLTSTVQISYGVLMAEVIRLVIFAGLLWGAGDLADLFVTSHRDLRATRILLGRLAHLVGQQAQHVESRPGDDRSRARGDATH